MQELVYHPELEASITYVEHPKHEMFFLAFDNGYENIFFRDVESGNWIEQDLGTTSLSADVGAYLDTLVAPADSYLTLEWLAAEFGENEFVFGFHLFELCGVPAFDIYAANKRFLLTIMKLDEETWKAFRYGGGADWNFVPGWIEKLPYILEEYI